MAARKSRSGAFTLLELIIALVIVAVLMSVALPGYQDSLRKGRRSDAVAALLRVAARQEQYMLHRQRYSNSLRELGFAADPLLSDQGYYVIQSDSCVDGSITSCYRLSAAPVPGTSQARDTACAEFFLDSLGQRTAAGLHAESCW